MKKYEREKYKTGKPTRSRKNYLLVIALCLSGCAETGDFGRPKPSLWNNLILEPPGYATPEFDKTTRSPFHFTDDEVDLRNRAWRFLMPSYQRSFFDSAISNLFSTGKLFDTNTDPTNYFRNLTSGKYTSPSSRYQKLAEDIGADGILIGAFVQKAREVLSADQARLRSLNYVKQLTEEQATNAAARVGENRCLIAWVRHDYGLRLAAYRYALEHLFIETPQNDSLAVERILTKFAAQKSIFDDLSSVPPLEKACGTLGAVHINDQKPSIHVNPIITKG